MAAKDPSAGVLRAVKQALKCFVRFSPAAGERPEAPGSPGPRRHMLRIARFRRMPKARSLRCSASPGAARFAGPVPGSRTAMPSQADRLYATFRLFLAQQLENALRHLVRLGLGVTCSVSLASGECRKLVHFAVPPLPARPASLGPCRVPGRPCRPRLTGSMPRSGYS